MDAAGARALRKRIEAYNSGNGPASDDQSEPGSPVYPVVSVPDRHDEEPDGGGAGELSRRIALEEERRNALRPAVERSASARRAPDPGRRAYELSRKPPSALPTIALSTGLAILASAVTCLALLAFENRQSSATIIRIVQPKAAPVPVVARVAPRPVHVQAVGSYNPFGTGPEHDAIAPMATDGSTQTYWSTETYLANGFQKAGTGLVLAATGPVRPTRLVLFTDTPGFQAQIRVSDSPGARFRADSAWKTVDPRTVFALHGKTGRYWLVWLRLPSHTGHAHVNEVRLFR